MPSKYTCKYVAGDMIKFKDENEQIRMGMVYNTDKIEYACQLSPEYHIKVKNWMNKWEIYDWLHASDIYDINENDGNIEKHTTIEKIWYNVERAKVKFVHIFVYRCVFCK